MTLPRLPIGRSLVRVTGIAVSALLAGGQPSWAAEPTFCSSPVPPEIQTAHPAQALGVQAGCSLIYVVNLPGHHNIEITGTSSGFCTQVRAALDQIRLNSSVDFAMIAGPNGQVDRIVEGSGNWANGGARHFTLGAGTAASLNFCAGTIVHEAGHLYLFNYLKTSAFGCDGEARQLERQALYLERVSDVGTANSMRNYKGNWDVDGAGPCGLAALPPVVDIGADMTVAAVNGFATVALDGFSTTDNNERVPSGQPNPAMLTSGQARWVSRPQAYQWTVPTVGALAGPFVQANLPPGTHQIQLTVSDSSGKTHSDTKTVTVTGNLVVDNTPPNRPQALKFR